MALKTAGSRRRSPGLVGRVAIAAIALGVLAAAADGARWNWSGSVVVDYKKIFDVPDEEPLAKVGVVVEPSVKATVDVSDRI
jgi:hypothetical protein